MTLAKIVPPASGPSKTPRKTITFFRHLQYSPRKSTESYKPSQKSCLPRSEPQKRLVKLSVYSISYIIYTTDYTIYTVYYIVYTIYYILYTMCYTLYAIYYTLDSIYYIRYTIYYILYTIYIFCTCLYVLSCSTKCSRPQL